MYRKVTIIIFFAMSIVSLIHSQASAGCCGGTRDKTPGSQLTAPENPASPGSVNQSKTSKECPVHDPGSGRAILDKSRSELKGLKNSYKKAGTRREKKELKIKMKNLNEQISSCEKECGKEQ